MDDKNLDKEINESLLKNTNDVSAKKDDIWKNIETKLALDEKSNSSKQEENTMEFQPRSRKNTKKRKSKGWLTGTIAAAIVLGVFTTTTDTGQAFVNNIKEYFAPEKQVVEEIEGMPEEKEVVLKESKAGYVIYIDEERYNLVEGLVEEDGVDKIVFNQELGEQYPEVSMSIRQVEDRTPDQLADEIYAELQNSYATVREIETVNDPVEGLLVSAIDGNEWNSPVTRVYIVSNEKEGSFVIEQKFFLEAEEGHGARFQHMLREFTIVEIEEE